MCFKKKPKGMGFEVYAKKYAKSYTLLSVNS